MPVFDVYDVSKLEVEMLSGKEDVGAGNGAKQAIYYDDGVPGIIWFRRSGGREYEVLEYDWSGPRFTDVMIQDNQTSTNTFSKRKGRVAGALIGTILMPGIGTVIGAAVGTGRKETATTSGQAMSHIETREVPAVARMRLRDLDTDEIFSVSFMCDSSLDTRIRNTVAANLEPLDVIEYEERPLLEEPVRKPDDILEQISRLKNLLDAEAISREEYETLKKKLFEKS